MVLCLLLAAHTAVAAPTMGARSDDALTPQIEMVGYNLYEVDGTAVRFQDVDRYLLSYRDSKNLVLASERQRVAAGWLTGVGLTLLAGGLGYGATDRYECNGRGKYGCGDLDVTSNMDRGGPLALVGGLASLGGVGLWIGSSQKRRDAVDLYNFDTRRF